MCKFGPISATAWPSGHGSVDLAILHRNDYKLIKYGSCGGRFFAYDTTALKLHFTKLESS